MPGIHNVTFCHRGWLPRRDGQIVTLLFDTHAARGITHCPPTIDYFGYMSLATQLRNK